MSSGGGGGGGEKEGLGHHFSLNTILTFSGNIDQTVLRLEIVFSSPATATALIARRLGNFKGTEPGVVTLWNTQIGDGVKSLRSSNALELSLFSF